jgi:hypothetical protein
MDSLRAHFQVLDRQPIPDLWPTIERRIAQPLEPAAPRVTWRSRPAQQPLGRATAFLAAVIVVTVGAGLLVAGANWLRLLPVPPITSPSPSPLAGPSDAPSTLPTAAASQDCAESANEASATTTYLVGTTQADRSWVADGAAIRFEGRIAGFDAGGRRILLLDPATGESCALVELTTDLWVQGSPSTTLAWSPTGGALAIGGPSPTRGRLLIWSPGHLRTVWNGNEGPVVAWSPSGDRIAVLPAGLRWGGMVFADGAPDQAVDGAPQRLAWSPEGTSLAMQPLSTGSIPLGEFPFGTISIRSGDQGIVQLDDGALEPILVGWEDEQTLLVVDGNRLLQVPVTNPDQGTVRTSLSPDLAGRFLQSMAHVAPDLRHVAYVAGTADDETGQLRIADLTNGTEINVPGTGRGQLMTWSADGGELAFDDEENRLWMVNSDGSGLRQLTSEPFFVLDGSWQP